MQQFPDEFEILTESASPQSGSQPGDRIDQEEIFGSLAVRSLLPVVQPLSGLTLDNKTGYYYIHGQIPELDRESFHMQAKRIGELILREDRDVPCDACDVRFSPQVFARLAQLQVPNGPLFPSLHRLSIMGLSTALDFLHLFLTPSLTALEITTIPVDGVQYPLILSFLESAVCEASHIKDVILGPGQISGEILDICLKYQNIQRLELSSATLSITLQDLEHIGSLKRLESFILQGPSTPVESSESPAKAPKEPEYDSYRGSSMAPQPYDFQSWDTEVVPEEVPEEPIADVAEEAHEKVHPIPPSPGPSEWSRCVSPDPVPSPSTLLVDEQRTADGKKAAQITDNPSNCPNPPNRQLFTMLEELTVAGNPELIKDLINHVSSPDLRKLSVIFKSEDMSIESRKFPKKHGKSRVPTEPVLMRDDSESIISDVFNSSTQKWANTLVSVSFCDGRTVNPSISFPSDIFETLLLTPCIEKFEVTGFNVDSVDTALHRLKEISPSKLKVLHLPFHTAASGISLSRLRFIALHCPKLVSFRCRFKHLSNVPAYDTPDPLSHQLQVLSVANAEPHHDHHRLLQIARYLDSLFPSLRDIETRGEIGYNGDQWESVFNLIQLCQAVRLDVEYRLRKANLKTGI